MSPRRRFVADKPQEVPSDEATITIPNPEPSVPGVAGGKKTKQVGWPQGADEKSYTKGSMSQEIRLSKEIFDDMEQKEAVYFAEIDRMAKENGWSPLKVIQVKDQASRVVRVNAILKSNYVRMQADTRYRRKVQEPTMTESVIRYESQSQKQSALFYQLMGLDEMHEAKLGAAESKSKPTDVQIVMSQELSKKHMADSDAGGGDGEDE